MNNAETIIKNPLQRVLEPFIQLYQYQQRVNSNEIIHNLSECAASTKTLKRSNSRVN